MDTQNRRTLIKKRLSFNADLDAHFILQYVLKVMVPPRRVLIIMKKDCENVLEYNWHGWLDVVKVNQLLSWKHATL